MNKVYQNEASFVESDVYFKLEDSFNPIPGKKMSFVQIAYFNWFAVNTWARTV